MYGLKEKHIKAINSVFSKYPQIEKTILYGSRAKGNYRNGSDIDLTLVGNDLDLTTLFKIETELDDLLLPYKMDLSILHKIENPDLLEHIERVGFAFYKKIASEWKEYILEDFAEINPTERIPKGTIVKKIAMEVLQPFTKRVASYSEEEYKGGTKFRNGDTIMARITPSLENGKTSFVDILNEGEIGFGSTEYIVFREREGISDKDFIYYLTTSPIVRNTAIKSMTGSSGRQRVQTDVVKNHNILVPELPEQKQIAEILTSLDDKIDLLHRQNKTLEAMAETLFREWFVEGAETKKYRFEELVDSISIKHSFNKEKVIFLNTSDVYNGKVLHHDYSDIKGLPGQAKKSIRKDDILFTEIRPANKRFAYIDFDAEDYVVSTKLMVLRTKNVLDTSLLYLFLKQNKILAFLQMLAEARSGTFPQITFEHLKSVEMFVPKDSQLLQNIIEVFKDVVKKTFRNQTQVQTLEKLRDTLLPKLMSGEIKVQMSEHD